jgi:hypothetical protein
MAYPYYDNKLLIVYTNDDKTRKWFSCGYFAKGQGDLTYDNLTRKLTSTQMNAWFKSETIHLKKRMLICSILINDRVSYFTVRWDEEQKDINVEPLIFQRSKNKYLDDAFVFSQKGDWIKTLALPMGNSDLPPELLIFHTGDIYPQGLSLPILCGYTTINGYGAFMEHETWGPCYIEWDSDYPKILFIYHLNKGLEMLAEQAKKTSGDQY